MVSSDNIKLVPQGGSFQVRFCLNLLGSVSKVHGGFSIRDLFSISGGQSRETAIAYNVFGSLGSKRVSNDWCWAFVR